MTCLFQAFLTPGGGPYTDFVRFSGTVNYLRRLRKNRIINAPDTGQQ